MGESGPASLRIRDDDVAWRRVGKDIMILNLPSSDYFKLNGTAAALWEKAALESGVVTFDQLVDFLIGEWRIDADRARADVRHYLDKLADFHLIEV